MPLIQWTQAMSVQHEELDRQHQHLLELYNTFDDAAHRGRGWRELHTMLGELENYTREHFGFEEKILEAAHYADLEHHRNLHRQLERKLAAFREEVAADRRVTAEFRAFLGYWWQSHILEHDQDYAKSLFPGDEGDHET